MANEYESTVEDLTREGRSYYDDTPLRRAQFDEDTLNAAINTALDTRRELQREFDWRKSRRDQS